MQDLNSGKRLLYIFPMCFFHIFPLARSFFFFFCSFYKMFLLITQPCPYTTPNLQKKIRIRPLEKYKYFDSVIQNRRELTMQKRLVLSIAKIRARSSRCCGLIFAHCVVVLLKCSETLAVKATLKSEAK